MVCVTRWYPAQTHLAPEHVVPVLLATWAVAVPLIPVLTLMNALLTTVAAISHCAPTTQAITLAVVVLLASLAMQLMAVLISTSASSTMVAVMLWCFALMSLDHASAAYAPLVTLALVRLPALISMNA